MAAPILDPTRWWECPSCGHQRKTDDPRPISPMHQCPSHSGVDVPLVQVHTNSGIRSSAVRHVVVPRDDYIGGEVGATRVMAVRTERADGSNDTHVFAPTATMKGR